MQDVPRKPTVREWLALGAIVALGLALRLVYVWQVRDSGLVAPDDLDPGFYFSWAREIAGGAWLGSAAFVQSPLYAYLLAGFIKMFGTALTPIMVAQSLVGCGTIVLTWLAGRRYFDATHGLLAALLLALYGPFIFYEGMVMKTFLSPFLTILLALVLARLRGTGADQTPASGKIGAFLLAGLVFGLLTLDRDNFIVLAPFLALLAAHLGGGWRRGGLKAAGAFALGAALMVAPVTLRNWAVSHEFVLLTTGGGEVFFIGNNADATGLYVPPPFVRPDPKFEHADFIARASEIAGRTLTPMQSSWFWFRQGTQFIAEEPLAWLRLLWLKMASFWNWYELPDNLDYGVMQWFSPLLRALNPVLPPAGSPTLAVPTMGGWLPVRLHLYATFGLLAPLGLLGLIRSLKRRRDLLPLYVLLFGYMGTVLLFFNFSRFRVPVVPILALFAAEGILALGSWLRRVWGLVVAVAGRSGDIAARARAILPGAVGAVAGMAFLLSLGFVNIERPRGVLAAIEQALIIGNAYYAQEQPEKAQASFTTALVLLGEGPPGAAGDALLQAQFGAGISHERLLKELDVEAVARGPQYTAIHVGVHHGLGISLLQEAQVLLAQGKRVEAIALIDQAIAQFHEVFKLVPSYVLSHRKMAQAWLMKGDTATARDWLQKALELWPEDLQARLDLAELLYAGGEFPRALHEIETAVHYNAPIEPTQMAQIYFNRGLIYFRGLEDGGIALYDFEKALELDPAHPQAASMRDAIRELRARGQQPAPDDALIRAEKPSPAAGGS